MSTHLPTGLVAAVREFTTNIVNPYDPQELLHRLTEQAIEVVRADGAGIMLAEEPRGLAFAAASAERVMVLEQLQGRIETGACHAAFTHDRIVTVEDLAVTTAWPEYSARAADLGLRAVMGVPMHAGGQSIGVLNVYREAPGPWSGVDVEAAEILTAIAGAYVLHANELRAQHTLAEQLHEALRSRDVIGQAKGILMARHQVDADAAFDLLRKRSQSVNRKLREVAQELVDSE
ncbi:GAF and ANTAR domain-containing protein [Nitriliruptor alkaliphilus]|uniref:GAF and ANTAR domain-containing protein n=1 Tax=Nitriliruptor alkaliphilus TaxID=427918 RepID=UPI000B0F761A|nr:GAF and ANTAR domain-containing protein [Nitriliruptor alkaliphilus]